MPSGPFKCHFGILMWPIGYFVEMLLENRSEKGKELVKHAECSDVLIECKLLAAMSGKVNSIQKFPGQGSLES